MKKACLFDFDGVLVDSEKYHYIAWRAVAEKMGTTLGKEEYGPLKSTNVEYTIRVLLDKAGKRFKDGDVEKYFSYRQSVALPLFKTLNEKDVMEGAVEFVKLLKQNGIPCAVSSASPDSTRTAKRLQLYDLFDAFVDGNDKLPCKPNPDIYLKAAKLLNVAPRDCIVFEDSIAGIVGAKNAGMYCVGFQTYFTDLADTVIDGFKGLDVAILNV
ncbi:MAG: HAD family phosphatase [Corallococcus sp.]|nr:HAD family phosphatase [Bacillota bacterium]MCM1533901.1 HAD family phosphatase [Corallococcus sp.]